MEEERTGFINGLKTLLRSWPWLYRTLIYVISPVCLMGTSSTTFAKRFAPDAIVLNIGSGIHRIAPKVLNVDIYWYLGVDIIADAHHMPLADGSVDGVICDCILEHVPDPQGVMKELQRILRPGGQAYLCVPFVYPFHACPNDFYRWSTEGLRLLCKGMEVEVIASRSGPTSALVALLVTWFAIVFSFGSTTLYDILSTVLLLVFFPLKFLDLLFNHFPTAINSPAALYAIARKPDTNTAGTAR